MIGNFEVLQLCSHPVVGWPDAPPGIVGLWSIQVATIGTGGDSPGRGLVSALFTFVSRCGGVARRVGFARRSRHGVAMGPAVRARIAAVLTPLPEAHQ